VATGLPFLDHMLLQLQRHGRFLLEVEARGDLEVDVHHLVEDVGITLGMALKEALGEGAGLERYAEAFAPMDETLVLCVLDLSGRPHLEYRPEAWPAVVAARAPARLARRAASTGLFPERMAWAKAAV